MFLRPFENNVIIIIPIPQWNPGRPLLAQITKPTENTRYSNEM